MDSNPLGPDAIDDGDAGRQQRGMAIAALTPVVKNKFGYKVPSHKHWHDDYEAIILGPLESPIVVHSS